MEKHVTVRKWSIASTIACPPGKGSLAVRKERLESPRVDIDSRIECIMEKLDLEHDHKERQSRGSTVIGTPTKACRAGIRPPECREQP